MAKVEWSAGIDSVSGALSKPGKNGQHRCAKMLLGTHRVAETTSSDCNRVYLRKKVKRSTPVTTKEMRIRVRFAAVAAAVAARKDSLEYASSDQGPSAPLPTMRSIRRVKRHKSHCDNNWKGTHKGALLVT